MTASAHMPSRLTARVHGHVQGVGYRFFVRREAAARGIRGYVRNLPDGSVEVVAEAARGELEQLLWALERGPLGAEVTSVDSAFTSGDGTLANFQIRH